MGKTIKFTSDELYCSDILLELPRLVLLSELKQAWETRSGVVWKTTKKRSARRSVNDVNCKKGRSSTSSSSMVHFIGSEASSSWRRGSASDLVVYERKKRKRVDTSLSDVKDATEFSLANCYVCTETDLSVDGDKPDNKPETSSLLGCKKRKMMLPDLNIPVMVDYLKLTPTDNQLPVVQTNQNNDDVCALIEAISRLENNNGYYNYVSNHPAAMFVNNRSGKREANDEDVYC